MSIPKYSQPLVIPSVMPPSRVTDQRTEYEIAARQFRQQILPPPMPTTTVWGYGRDGDPLPEAGAASTFAFPAFTVETRANRPVRVSWVNRLVNEQNEFLPHLLPVDSTIHWANPGATSAEHGTGHGMGHDMSGSNPRYTGPVPIVTHVHGAHAFDHSDGHPEAWSLPNASNIPSGFARRGPHFATQAEVGAGAAVFDYPQDENAATLWYHDHTLGMTRVNIYAGLAGFWIIRDDVEDALNLPGPAPRHGDPPGMRYYEIPILVQDRTFTPDGSLSFPASRSEYDDYKGPVFPDSNVPPIWGPEFFGNAMVVNGRTWPFLEVEPRLYRFRLLNASDARTLMLELDRAGLEFVKIGTDGGLLPDAPVHERQLLVGPAERADVLVDFSGLSVGETITLRNHGPDEAWGGPNADPPQKPANPDTTGQVMQFRVVPLTHGGTRGAIPQALPAREHLSPTAPPRDLLLAELTVQGDFPIHVQLGTVTLGPLPWSAPTSEVVTLDDTEVWRVANTTEDAHPIHLHLVEFQILDRIPFDAERFKAAEDAWLAKTGPEPKLDDFVTGAALPIPPGEGGPKDTAMMLPGTITRIVARFDRAGTFVWHCHIIEHEDNDMMRPFEVVAPTPTPLNMPRSTSH